MTRAGPQAALWLALAISVVAFGLLFSLRLRVRRVAQELRPSLALRVE